MAGTDIRERRKSENRDHERKSRRSSEVDTKLDSSRENGHNGITIRRTYNLSERRNNILSGLVLLLTVIITIVILCLWYVIFRYDIQDDRVVKERIPACNVDGEDCVAHRQRYKKGAVAADDPICSQIGNVILSEKGGSIVDSAIATMLCLGVVHLQSSGIGGGGFYLFYNRTERKTYEVNARAVAPLKAFKEMFANNHNASQSGGVSIAVPGEVAGYALLHSRFGKLNWSELFTPSINLCKNGFTVGFGLNLVMKNFIFKYEGLKETLINPKTKDLHRMGDIIRLPKLAKSLQRISDLGAEEFYNGTLAENIVADIKDAGGIITEQDLKVYKAKLGASLDIELNDGNTLHTAPSLSSGSLVGLIYNIMSGYEWRSDTLSCQEASIVFHHRFIEACKYAFSIRHRMGDPDFMDMKEIMKNVISQQFADYIRSRIHDNRTYDPEHYGPVGEGARDQGTTHLSIMDDEGNAFSATTSISKFFGSKTPGKRTGIFFANSMNDFSIPDSPNRFDTVPSKENFIAPGKRPISSMAPTIITDKDGDVVLVVGASGAGRIVSATSYVMLRTLVLNDDLKNAIDAARIHHEWIPNKIEYERKLEKYLIDGLKAKGHEMFVKRKKGGAVVQGLLKEYIQTYGDVRNADCPVLSRADDANVASEKWKSFSHRLWLNIDRENA